jgi:single-strand DNA-binding protein
MNKVILMGRLTRDPEIRHTPSGSAVASFGLAVDKYSKENGRQADFFDIVCWERRAEFASKWLKKGSAIALSGRLQQSRWKDKEGGDRSRVEVVADELEFAGSKPAGEGGGYAQDYGYSQPPAAAAQPLTEPSGFRELQDDDGELPF